MHKVAAREKELHLKATPGGFVVPIGKKWKLAPAQLGKRKRNAIEKGIQRNVREDKRQKREREEALMKQQEEEAEKAKEQQNEKEKGREEDKTTDDMVVELKVEGNDESKKDTGSTPSITITPSDGTQAGDGEKKSEERKDDKKDEGETTAPTRMSEEERLSKISELEDKLKSLDDQKHKLFLLLKQVISVEEQKRSKQAKEEERIRLEEQSRRENTRRLEQLKVLSQTKIEDPAVAAKPFNMFGGRHSSPFTNKPASSTSRFGITSHNGGGLSPQQTSSMQQNGGKSPFHRKHRISDSGNGSGTSSNSGNLSPFNGSSGKPDRSPQHPSGAPSSPPSMQMGHPQGGPRGRGPHGNAPNAMFPFGVVQTVPPFAMPPESGHFPQVPPVHIPGHLAMGPHGLPLSMLPAQLALQAQMSHLGLHGFPPHMLGRPGPGLLPTPNHQRGRGRGDRRRRGGFW